MEIQGLPSVHCQCHGCWWPANARSYDISRHGNSMVIPEIYKNNHVRIENLGETSYQPWPLMLWYVYCELSFLGEKGRQLSRVHSASIHKLQVYMHICLYSVYNIFSHYFYTIVFCFVWADREDMLNNLHMLPAPPTPTNDLEVGYQILKPFMTLW